MLAPRQIHTNYLQWNHVHGAPYGRQVHIPRLKRLFTSPDEVERLRGPFAIQPNNTTREFEYPWAFESGGLEPGMSILEIGGGLAGFQFVLDKQGCRVVNVDPGMPGVGWPCDKNSMDKLNRRFETNVELINSTVDNAGLPDNSFDRVFSISVIEHLTPQQAANVMHHVHSCLKPGGLFIITADLFLNLEPFCSRKSNEHGTNMNIKSLIDEGAWDLIKGERNCLYGFPEFSADFVLGNLEMYYIGRYPALAQCFVLKKR